MMHIRKGFTLIEVLIVVLIIGALASLVIARYFGQEERGIVSEAVTHLSAIRQAESSYYLENSAYTADFGLLDIDVTSSTKFTYTVDAATGNATATRVGGDFNGDTIILNMDGTWDPSATHPYKPK